MVRKYAFQKSGSGPTSKFPELEKHLYRWFYRRHTGQSLKVNADSEIDSEDEGEADEASNFKQSVDYRDLWQQAIHLHDKMGIAAEELKCSDFWLFKFLRRHKLSCRRYTHRGQADSRAPLDIANSAARYLENMPSHTAGLTADVIVNMDETPCYFDMCSERTLSFKGEKNVPGVDTGHRKSRFTVVLAVTASGRVLKSLVIFKNLKKPPKVNLPKNVIITVSKGGSMNTGIMLKWIESCFKCRGPYLANTKSLLVMDQYGSHKKQEVLEQLKKATNTYLVLIPPKMMSFLQPLDVSINYPFKLELRRLWNIWLRDGSKEYTPKGYRKRPSYQEVINMVSLAMDSLKRDVIKRSFLCCGICEKGQNVPLAQLNKNLQMVLSVLEKGIAPDVDLNHLGLEDSDEEESDQDEIVEEAEESLESESESDTNDTDDNN